MARATITRKIQVVAAPVPGTPEWRQGMAPWEWKELVGTAQFSGQQPADSRYGASVGRLNAWNGFAAKGSHVYIAGMGGHADYSGNEAYALNLGVNVPSWQMLCEPSDWDDRIWNSAYYADGRPSSGHLYYTLHVVGNEIIRVRNDSQWGDGNYTDRECVAFDLAANDWTCANDYNGNGTTWPDTPSGTIALAACKDPVSEVIYAVGSTRMHSRNPATGAWSNLATLPENGSAAYYRASAVDTLRNQMVIFGDDYNTPIGGLLYDITGDSISEISFSSADSGGMAATIAAINGASAYYMADIDRFILKTLSGDDVYEIHPETFVVTARTTTGGNSIDNAVNFVFNKFVHLPELGGFYYQPHQNANGWFLATE